MIFGMRGVFWVMGSFSVRSNSRAVLAGSTRSAGALWRQTPLSTALLALFTAPTTTTSVRAEDGHGATRLTIVSVPAGSLQQGLVALGQQTNLKLVYPHALAASKKTAGVAGRMTAKDAVKRLLAQTGLGFT